MAHLPSDSAAGFELRELLTQPTAQYQGDVIEQQKNLITSLRAELTESYRIDAQHQGEPVGWTYEGGKEFTACPDHAHDPRAEGIELSPVYRHPPTTDGFSAGDMADQGAKAFRDGQRALVLPDRMGESTKGNGWNACLDEVRRLNEACITPE
ncbi:hypothetical protein D3C77_591730 [compost metagenome]